MHCTEILGVPLSRGLVGRLDLPGEQVVEVHFIEEDVLLQVVEATGHGTQSLAGILLEQFSHEVRGCLVLEALLRAEPDDLPGLLISFSIFSTIRTASSSSRSRSPP